MRLRISTVHRLVLSIVIVSVALIGSIFCPNAATAATYYVATNGNNANPGTKVQPLQTIRKGLSVLRAGDTLYLRGGTYGESIDDSVQTIARGTSWSNPITIAGYSGETVILQPSSGDNVISLYASVVQYVMFDRLILDATNTTGGVFVGCNGVGCRGSDHIIIQNGEVKNARQSGILTYSPGSAEIKFINLNVHHNGGSRLDHGFYIATPNTLIDGCDIHDNSGYGIHLYNGYGDRTDNFIARNNKVHNNRGDGGVTLSHGNGILFYNNIVYSHLNGIEVSYKIINAQVYNNTVYNHPQGTGIGIGSESTNAVIKNNIIYQNGIAIGNQGTGTLLSQNMATDPKFMNAAANDFHLQPRAQRLMQLLLSVQ
jgi:hypothetical protein